MPYLNRCGPPESIARFRILGALQDFLPPALRGHEFERSLSPRSTAKDTIESIGVPHPEIGEIRVNGVLSSAERLLEPGDSIEVSEWTRAPSPEPPTFVLDTHLGRLAGYLRMIGFDTWYRAGTHDPELAAVSAGEQRILLTRDVGLLKRKQVVYGCFVRETAPRRQFREVALRYDLFRRAQPFVRCMACNSVLQAASPAAVAHRVPERAASLHQEFKSCPGCGRVYWPGSHWRRMVAFIESSSFRQES